jgi:pimeloyl-ACP methyl ester carboxylesterase
VVREVQQVWFDSSGARLFGETSGRGVPLVLLHGSGLSTHAIFAGLHGRLANTFQVIACDVRGFGRSISPDQRTHTWDQYVDDVLALLDSLALPSAVVGGQSFGSGIALATALRHPDRVQGLVIAQPGYAGADIGQTNAQRPVWTKGRTLVDAAREHGLLTAMLNEQPAEGGQMWVRRAVAEHDEASFLAAHSGQLQTVQPFLSLVDLQAVEMPVLLIPGDDDAHDPWITDMYASHLPQVIIGGSSSADPLTWADDLLTFGRRFIPTTP